MIWWNPSVCVWNIGFGGDSGEEDEKEEEEKEAEEDRQRNARQGILTKIGMLPRCFISVSSLHESTEFYPHTTSAQAAARESINIIHISGT